MGKSEFDGLFKKFVNGACTEEERKMAELRLGALPDLTPPPPPGKTAAGDQNLSKEKIVKNVKNLRSSIIWKIAATLAAGSVAIYFLYPRYIGEGRVSQHENHDKNIISNGEAIPRQVKLDDGSEVRLEPNSI